MQWVMSISIPIFALPPAFACFKMMGMIKKRTTFDIPLFFMAPTIYISYYIYRFWTKHMWEIGYPAHPLIIEERRKVLNVGCFFAPSMLKNEIEFM